MKLIQILLIITCIAFAEDRSFIIMVSFDGFRYDYIEKINTPNLDFVIKNGVKAESLIPVFPSLTFPNHYSIATGCFTETHKIMGNSFYSKEYNEYYSYKDSQTVQNGKFYDCEPIWVTAERQNIRTATYFWVGSEAKIKGYYPSIYKNYDSGVDFISRIDSALAWIELPIEKRPRLIMLYFNEPDYTAHKYGPLDASVFEKVKYLDNILGELIIGINKISFTNKINLIIVSDHGMASISKNRMIILDEYIDLNNWNVNGSGPLVQLTPNRNYNKIKMSQFWIELQNIPNIKAYKKEHLPEYFHFNNINTGEFIVMADEGWMISKKNIQNNNIFSLKGMHGFDSSSKKMHGIFYAMGPDFIKGMTINSFDNIHIYPLLCNILDIQPYEGEFDTPEGKLSVLQNILK